MEPASSSAPPGSSAATPPRPGLAGELELARRTTAVVEAIHAAESVQDILVNLTDGIRRLLGSQALTLYAVDVKNQQLYSIFRLANARQEIRVPKSSKSIAGHCAVGRQPVLVKDAYDEAELRAIHPQLELDRSWDQLHGFRTKQVLAVPLLKEQYLLGVLQLINKEDGTSFSPQDVEAAEKIAATLAVAFYNQNRAARAAAPAKRHRFSPLIDKGLIAEDDFESAVTFARVHGKDLGVVLMLEHGISKEEVGRSLSEYYGLPFFAWNGEDRVPADLRERVPADFWRSTRCAPLAKRGGALHVATANPRDLEKLDAIKATGIAARLEVQVALDQDIDDYLRASFGERPAESRSESRPAAAATVTEILESEEQEEGEEAVVDGFVVRLVDKILQDAIRTGASDVHVEPNGDDRPLRIRFRRDGVCFQYEEIPAKHRAALVSRLKILSQIDISEKRKPQDGKIRFKLSDGTVSELRVVTVPTAGTGNEDVVMRILAASKPIPIDQLGMSERNLERFKEAVDKPYGLVLCVGPTGSGKTTSLHSALGYINTAEVKIWTAEDPVEITQPGLRQVQVRPKIGFDFAAAMRSFLRADPDVIMLGEMRDEETAGTGIEASLTGHLVLSTLHTNSAPETLTRLLDMGLDPFNFADALLAVLAQRLVRTLCAGCKQAYQPDAQEVDELRQAYAADLPPGTSGEVDLSGPLTLYRAKGCERCTGTGYRGRMAIHELLVGTDEVKRLIVQRRPVEEIRKLAIEQGMTTLLQDGVWKVTLGHTDLKQVKAVCIR